MSKLERIFKQGVELESKGRREEALSKYKQGLKQEPSDREKMFVPMFHRHIAVIYEQMGEMLKAKRSHLNALKYGRPNSYTYLWLGDLSVSRGELAAARRYFARCEEIATLEKDEDLLKLLAKRKISNRSKQRNRYEF